MRCTIGVSVWVSWVFVDDYVTVWIVSVESLGINALDDNDVAYVEGAVEGMHQSP